MKKIQSADLKKFEFKYKKHKNLGVENVTIETQFRK